MRIVNIIPTQNSDIRLDDWEISSPAFNMQLTNQDIYKCINQKALVYEIINGKQVLITLANIKKDLVAEAEAEAEAKKTEIERLNKVVEDLRREVFGKPRIEANGTELHTKMKYDLIGY